MKFNRIAAALALVLLISATGCINKADKINKAAVDTSADGSYAGFDTIAAGYTPEQATADGCMVIVSDGSSDKDGNGTLFAGENVFSDFRGACERGDAKMRTAYFGNSGVSFTDLIYSGGDYYYIDSGSPKEISRFGKLRALEGRFGSPERDTTYYVLTDSDELTANDVYWYYLLNDTEKRTKIPFVWLGFTSFLTD